MKGYNIKPNKCHEIEAQGILVRIKNVPTVRFGWYIQCKEQPKSIKFPFMGIFKNTEFFYLYGSSHLILFESKRG